MECTKCTDGFLGSISCTRPTTALESNTVLFHFAAFGFWPTKYVVCFGALRPPAPSRKRKLRVKAGG